MKEFDNFKTAQKELSNEKTFNLSDENFNVLMKLIGLFTKFVKNLNQTFPDYSETIKLNVTKANFI